MRCECHHTESVRIRAYNGGENRKLSGGVGELYRSLSTINRCGVFGIISSDAFSLETKRHGNRQDDTYW